MKFLSTFSTHIGEPKVVKTQVRAGSKFAGATDDSRGVVVFVFEGGDPEAEWVDVKIIILPVMSVDATNVPDKAQFAGAWHHPSRFTIVAYVEMP